MPPQYTETTFILFSVRVPVLSLQIKLQLPKVSTACSLRTIALLLLIFCMPIAIIIVTTAGKPSGIAATAIATDDIKFSISGLCLKNTPKAKIITAMAITPYEMTLPKASRFFCKGVCISDALSSISAILPISVFIPVDTTTASALPCTTKVEENSIFFLSPKPAFLLGVSFEDFETAVDSPVNADSSHLRLLSLSSRQSAGTISPSSKIITSPATKS